MNLRVARCWCTITVARPALREIRNSFIRNRVSPAVYKFQHTSSPTVAEPTNQLHDDIKVEDQHTSSPTVAELRNQLYDEIKAEDEADKASKKKLVIPKGGAELLELEKKDDRSWEALQLKHRRVTIESWSAALDAVKAVKESGLTEPETEYVEKGVPWPPKPHPKILGYNPKLMLRAIQYGEYHREALRKRLRIPPDADASSVELERLEYAVTMWTAKQIAMAEAREQRRDERKKKAALEGPGMRRKWNMGRNVRKVKKPTDDSPVNDKETDWASLLKGGRP